MAKVNLIEWDDIEEKEVIFLVNEYDLINYENDADAALRIAYSIEDQQPELLEIAAKYMEIASELGSREARGWLANYYEDDDGGFDAWS